MAGTALHGRLTWQTAAVTSVTWETSSVCTIGLDLPDWPGHRAGQDVDVRLTAEDCYTAEREYSIALAPGEPLAFTGRPSDAHRHGNAFFYAYVLEGAVRSQLKGEPMRTYHQGENWIEQPGAHHVVTEDASNTEPAELLVVFVVVALRDDPRTVVTDPHASYVGTELGEQPCCRAPTRFSARSATATGRDESRPESNSSPKERR